MRVTVINPNVVSQRDDLSGSGIPYMPIGLAYLAGYLRSVGHDVAVIDAFGAAPRRIRTTPTQYIQGLTPRQTADAIASDVDVIVFYAHLTVAHAALLDIIRESRAAHPAVPTIVLENVDKVNAYSLRRVAAEFFQLGIDYVVLGYPERRVERLLQELSAPTGQAMDGVIRRLEPDIVVAPRDGMPGEDLDALPLPAWDLFPLTNYWKLGYAHGPLSASRYLPLLTSRGCPFNCGFCNIPEVSGRRWKARSPASVVDEMETLGLRYGVREFHLEDLNPTIDRHRVLAMCQLLIDRRLDVTWKVAQGTKLESLDAEVVDAMRRSGCAYVSISPESGSSRVLRLMGKPVDVRKAVEVVSLMCAAGIRTQACFVLGYPGETSADRRETGALVRRLARAGVDEVAIFLMTPMPGSRVAADSAAPAARVDQMTFTPTWRSDYSVLASARKSLYLQYVLWKAFYHPFRLLGYGSAFISRRFMTKVEMTIFRKLSVAWWARRVNQA